MELSLKVSIPPPEGWELFYTYSYFHLLECS